MVTNSESLEKQINLKKSFSLNCHSSVSSSGSHIKLNFLEKKLVRRSIMITEKSTANIRKKEKEREKKYPNGDN